MAGKGKLASEIREFPLEAARLFGGRYPEFVPTARNGNRAGDSPYHIPRLKDDYLLRLPGEGRQPLAAIFLAKLRRRATQQNIY